jgi:uncharacterized protein involved in type VI secretion and phage assembly
MMNAFPQLMPPPGADGRFYGVVIGIVTDNKDPGGLGRVKASLPWLADDAETDWARVVTPMAGARRGMYFLPEAGDEVLVAFEHGDPAAPYVLGSLWNGKDVPPESNGSGKNDVRVIRSRNGNVIRLSDAKDDEKIEITDASAKNTIVISTKDNSITITAASDVTIKSGGGKLTLSGNGVEITSAGAVKIEAGQGMDLKSRGRLTIKGATVDIN